MRTVSLLGIPNDDNSSLLKGPAKAPALIRRELHSYGHTSWSESGVELSVAGRFEDHGDIQFDSASDPWDLIEQHVARALEAGNPLICLGGDHAITHPIMRCGSQVASSGNRIRITSRIRSVTTNGSTPMKIVDMLTSLITLLMTNTFMPTGG